MNEQNNNLNNGVAPTQPVVATEAPAVQPASQPAPAPVTEAQPAAPVQAVTPVTEAPTQPVTQAPVVQPVQAVPATEVVTSAPVTEAPTQPVVATEAPAVQPAPQPAPAPVTEAQPAAPVQAVAPVTEAPTQPVTQAPVVQPVQAVPATEVVTSAPVTEAPTQPVVATEAPAVQPAPQPAPATQPVQTDIVQQEALNPLANEPAQPAAPANNGTIAPSAPLQPPTPVGGAINSNGVGFVAASAPPKKKANKPLIIVIVLVILAALGAVGYFVIYPLVMSKLTNPKTVYETAIRETFKSMNETVTEVVHDKAIYDLNLYLDSNMELLQSYTGYTYNLNVGIDPTNEAIQAGFSIKDSTNAGHGYNTYLKDGKEYVRYSTHQRELIYVGEADLEATGEIFGSFKAMLSSSEKASSEDINYVLNLVSDLLVKSLDESKLSKEEASIIVNNQTIKVNNNKYTIDKTTLKNTLTTIYDGLKNDEKAVTILCEMLEVDEDTLKEMLTYTEDEDSEENDTVLTMSIYTTTGFNPTLVGYGLKTNKSDSEIHYYTTENFYEFKLYSVEKNVETNKDEENTLLVTGVTSNGKTTVNIVSKEKIGDEEEKETTLATLTIKDWTDTAKEFDYVINLDEENKITGTVKYTTELSESMNKYGLDLSIKLGEEYINIVLNFSEDWKSEVAKINVNEAVTKSDDQIAEIHTEFINLLLTTPIGELFQSVSGDTNEDVYDYYYEIDSPEYDDSVIQDEYYYEDDSVITVE